MYIPEGVKVTSYTEKYFGGRSMTYHCPHNISCLKWDKQCSCPCLHSMLSSISARPPCSSSISTVFSAFSTTCPQLHGTTSLGQHLVETGGDYTWCTRSSDGSELYLNGELVVNNKCHHSDKQVCKKKRVPRGIVEVEACVFSSSGKPIMHVLYNGADTNGNLKNMCSMDAVKVAPKRKPDKSDWSLRVFR